MAQRLSLEEWLKELENLKDKLEVLDGVVPDLGMTYLDRIELKTDMSTVITRLNKILDSKGV